MKNKTNAAKAVKAKRRYLVSGHPFGKLYENGGWTIDTTGKQVSVLPRSAATLEAMVEQGAKALMAVKYGDMPKKRAEYFWRLGKHGYTKASRAVLESIGLT